MIYEKHFINIQDLNNFVVNENILRSEILSIQAVYDRGNQDWGIVNYILFYFKPSILGDDQWKH